MPSIFQVFFVNFEVNSFAVLNLCLVSHSVFLLSKHQHYNQKNFG